MGRKLTSRAASKGGASISSKPSEKPPAGIGDNSLARERAEQAQLLSVVSRLRQQAPKTEAAKAALDAEKATEKEIYRLAKAAGFEKKEVEEYLEDLKPGQGHHVEEREVKRARRRKWLGLAVGERQDELELEGRMPEENRDELHWTKAGFAHGLTGGTTADPLPAGMPSRFTQPYLRAIEAGSVEGLKLIADNLPEHQRAAAVAGAIALQAASDFAADNPEVDLDAAAKKLKKDPVFMARGGGEEPAVSEPAAPPPGDEPFEATEEEISAQNARQAVVNAREGRTSGEAVPEDEGGEVV